jgi:hypothetical protein
MGHTPMAGVMLFAFIIFYLFEFTVYFFLPSLSQSSSFSSVPTSSPSTYTFPIIPDRLVFVDSYITAWRCVAIFCADHFFELSVNALQFSRTFRDSVKMYWDNQNKQKDMPIRFPTFINQWLAEHWKQKINANESSRCVFSYFFFLLYCCYFSFCKC